ncbi:MAG TPA: hypothetical protein VHD91_12250 [Gaiellaceae bacterium]|nr:hypothetical protein [Gaiellaceae bacterium]
METFASEQPRAVRVLRYAGVFLAAAIVVAAVAVGSIVVWLRSYAPLDAATGSFAPGPGVGAVVEPAAGSGGKVVFFPAYRRGRTFVASLTLHNSGHFSVTVQRLVPAKPQPPPWIGADELLTTDSTSFQGLQRFQPFSLGAGATAVLVARFRPLCPAGRRRLPSVFTDELTLRYRYLHWFTRTQTISLPFAVTLRCVGGPLAQP